MNDVAFEIILDECLDAVLSGERTIADCLVQYPDYADELKPALQIALLTTHLKKPEMDAGRIDALECACVTEYLLLPDVNPCALISRLSPK